MKSVHKHKGWNQEEDRAITELVGKHGIKCWAKIAREMAYHYGLKGKTGKQCRQRWYNHLNGGISKEDWTIEEENIMFEAHKVHGNKWKLIAEKLPGRTDNSIKNHFYSTIRRSLRRMSKLAGSKNSTLQMRKIKPITLSRIFCVAEGREEQEDDTLGVFHPSSANAQKKQQIMQQLRQNCEQIAYHLRQFTREKPKQFDEKLSKEQIQLYKTVLNKMIEINELYEGEKKNLIKFRKEKKLETNFDKVSISSDPDEEEEHCEISPLSQSINSQQNIIRSFKSRRLPSFNPVDAHLFENKQDPVKIQDEVKIEECEARVPQIQNFGEGVEKNNFEDQNNNEYELSIDLEQPYEMNLFSFEISPRVFHTPLALTPTMMFDSMNKQQAQNIQPIKNEDCNNFVERLKEKVQKKNKNQDSKREENHILYPSPSSAFKPCI